MTEPLSGLSQRVVGEIVQERQDAILERDRLREFVQWVADHRLVPGVYADAEHPYDEWVTPDGAEEDFSEVVERAREALRVKEPCEPS